jgi:hypothetical protein
MFLNVVFDFKITWCVNLLSKEVPCFISIVGFSNIERVVRYVFN